MAHGLINKGINTTFVSRKELPWHRLGKIVDAMTSEEAIKLGGLNFEVGLSPIYSIGQKLERDSLSKYDNIIRTSNESNIKIYSNATVIKNKFATIRTDTMQPLGIVGSRYQPIQNIEAFNFFDSFIGEGHTQYETVGALGNGEVIFITAKLPDYIKVNGENIDNYLLFTMAHDGSGAIQVLFTPIRVVCNNTLSLALGSCSNKVTFRHTKSAKDKLRNLDKVLNMTNENAINLSKSFNRLQDIRVSDIEMEKLTMEVLNILPMKETGKLSTKSKNILENVLNYYQFGLGQSEIKGTAWGVLNGITGYLQNVKNYRSDENSFNATFIKSGISNATTIRQKLFDKLLEIPTPNVHSFSGN